MTMKVQWETADAAKSWERGIKVLVQTKNRMPMLYSHFRPDWVETDHYGRGSRYMQMDEVLEAPFAK